MFGLEASRIDSCLGVDVGSELVARVELSTFSGLDSKGYSVLQYVDRGSDGVQFIRLFLVGGSMVSS